MLTVNFLLLFVIKFSCIHISKGELRLDPLVTTDVGLIRGLRASDGDYAMFLGIPYAKVNETNPFGPSIPYPKFESEFQAYDDTAQCPLQEDSGAIVGTLDCLHLNIYVPNSASYSNRLPILVWIYGGNFERGQAGRGAFGPKFLVRHDVIVITLNHRTGLYGFMCLDIPEVPGNQGLKDQVRALRWIKEHIVSFGGDVNKITVFGESSGARSIDFHLVSPQEKLFNNAILQSGTSLTRDTIFEADTEAPLKIAQKLGYPVTSVFDALNYLSTVEPHWAVAAAAELELVIKPCIEKYFDNVERLITDYTINLDELPKVKNTSILIGYNDNEQIARYADKNPNFFDNLNIIHDRLKDYFNFEENKLKEMEDIVHHFYLGDEEISEKILYEIVDFDSAFSYISSTERTIDMYHDNRAGDVFYYVFSYVGNRNYDKHKRNVTVGRASHADDIGYLFDMQNTFRNDPTSEDQLVIDIITTLWTNFAKFGNPTPQTTELLPVKWEPITKDCKYYMNISSELSLGKRPFHDQTAFWDLFYKTNWKYQKGFRT